MHLLRSRQFALLFVGTAANAIGTWAGLVAMWGYAAFEFDAGATQVAVLGLAWGVPSALLGPLAGVPIDRHGPRRVLVWAYSATSLVAFVMALADTYDQLLALSVLYGVSRAFTTPATAALAPRLVEDRDLMSANALLGAADESAIVFGPLVAAGAAALWGVQAAFVADALTYLIGLAVLVPLRLRPVDVPDERRSVRDDVVEGFRLARHSPVVVHTLLLSIAVFATWGSFLVIEPIYVREHLDGSATLFGVIQTAFGIGMVGTGLVISRLGNRVATPRALSASVVLSGLAAAIYVGTDMVAVALAGAFLWGIDIAFFAAPSRTLLQRATPITAHGRVLSLHSTLESWSDVVSIPVAGLVASAIGVRPLAFIAGGIAVVAGAVGFLRAPAPPPAWHEPGLGDAVPLVPAGDGALLPTGK